MMSNNTNPETDRIVLNALIEIPLNSKNKYEVDPETGRIHLDRVLYSAMNYPTEYGIVENTLAPDGDPLDILVICKEPTFPGCIVPARVLGYLSTVIVPVGAMGASRALLVASLGKGSVDVAAFFKEGLIKQNGAKQAVESLKHQL